MEKQKNTEQEDRDIEVDEYKDMTIEGSVAKHGC